MKVELSFPSTPDVSAEAKNLISQDSPSAARNLDLDSTLEARTSGTRPAGEVEGSNYNHHSILTIAFQFAFENHY
ncbi:homeobox-leucine zipper protein HOX32-like [Lycium barbarum]|uniref:homeobox-leucine zipper protein HOX32-like n=1 Tax=Lycium barbarum TaxID=112863 RepID=UPI00293F3161|nr:homeobox-leucine zipper protein HOX32-like [Lycium barbarum]